MALNRVIGKMPLSEVNQEVLDRVCRTLLGRRQPNPAPATKRAEVLVPARAILRHAAKRGWCDFPRLELPTVPESETPFMLPSEAMRQVNASAPHLKPLLIFLFGCGSRLGETLLLDWHEVDLVGARATFLAKNTKSRRRRDAHLPPSVASALASLPHRDGPVFLWQTKPGTEGRVKRQSTYAPRAGGGHIKTGWNAALRRAGLNPDFTPHCTRHSWASWHYAIYRDLLKLKRDGGWRSAALVERYAHLMPAGHDAEILAFWGLPNSGTYVARGPERSLLTG